MKTLLLTISLTLTLTHCVPPATSGERTDRPPRNAAAVTQDGVYTDRAFSSNVKTVRLLLPDEPLYTSTFPIDQNIPVVLSFDVLELDQSATYGDYSAKIIHCNADWQKSQLYDMDFLTGYNEFRITNETLSFNTKIPFGHYQVALPPVKMPGNYVIQVYQGTNEQDVLLTKRFMVYGRAAGIAAEVRPSSDVSRRNTSQQIEFTVNYGDINIPNPQKDIYVVIRQNQQWFNTIEGIKPTFVNETDRVLEYVPFDLSSNFYAGSEYRFFDLRTINAQGQNVGEIRRNLTPVEAFLLPDRSRNTEVYSQINDLNGNYVIGNLDQQGGELSADYILTHFFLEAERVPGDVYVTGEFNNRTLTPLNRMTYDNALKGYTADILLKQGFYNYLYYADQAPTPYPFDGNHFETENRYEIFVYARPIGARADWLIGYTSFFANPQNR